MRKLLTHHSLVVKEFDTGEVVTELVRLDPATRRVTCESLGEYQQTDDQPFTSCELLLMAAAERVARQLGYQPELPW